MSNQNFRDPRFSFDGALPDTEGEWADLDTGEFGAANPFGFGDYSTYFLAGLGSEAFEVRLVQGRTVPGDPDPEQQWFVAEDALPVAAGRAPGDGQCRQIGMPQGKVQIKTSAAVTRATIVVTARWTGR